MIGRTLLTCIAGGLALWYGSSAWAAPDAAGLYQTHCAVCHGADRLGIVGPAMLPGNLERLRKPAAITTISDGRIATQMPGFADKMTADEIKAVTELIYTPLATVPTWNMDQIRASRIQHVDQRGLGTQPVFRADPLNLFVVVELGDHHATILDGDKFEAITRFPTRYALHGGPKFSPDGRYVYFASRDGWIAKYDIWNLKLVAEVRAGLREHQVAGRGQAAAARQAPPLDDRDDDLRERA